MTPTINTRKERAHPADCLSIQEYGNMSHYVPREDYGGDGPETACQLCEHDITDEPDTFAPLALSLTVECVEASDPGTVRAYHDAIRHLITRTADRLRDAGYLDDRVGVSVTSCSDWHRKRSEATNTAEFDRLLMDALEVSLCFDIAYIGTDGCDSWDDLLSAAASGDFGMNPEKKVAKSLQWLSEYTDPSVKYGVTTFLNEQSDAPSDTDANAEAKSDTHSGDDGADTESNTDGDEPDAAGAGNSSSDSAASRATTLGEF